MALTTWINGVKNDLIARDGFIISNNAELTEAYTRIRTPRGQYLIDPEFGSLLYEKLNGRGIPSSYEVTELINDALLPMKNQGRVQKYVSQVVYPVTQFSIAYNILLYTTNGEELKFTDTYRI